jgi:hypothetical protein
MGLGLLVSVLGASARDWHTRDEVEDTLVYQLGVLKMQSFLTYQKWVGPSTADDGILGDVPHFKDLFLGRVGQGRSDV